MKFSNILKVQEVGSLNSSFGEKLVAQLTPKAQLQFPYFIHPRQVKVETSGSGTVTQNNGFAVVSTGATSNSTAIIKSRKILKYNPGQGGNIRFALTFTNPKQGSYQFIGLGDLEDGYFVGFKDLVFGVLKIRGGEQNFIPDVEFNRDRLDGLGRTPKKIFTNMNVFQVQYQWLGGGAIGLDIENERVGKYRRFHEIEYANSAVETSILNPSLPLAALVGNTTNDTDISINVSSMGAFVEGKVNGLGVPGSTRFSKASVGTALTNIFTIRNKSEFKTLVNRVPVSLLTVSYGVDGTKPGSLVVVENAVLGGTPNFLSLGDDLVLERDTAGTTVTGGVEISSQATGKSSEGKINLAELDYEINPGDSLTIAYQASSGSTDVSASCNWLERF